MKKMILALALLPLAACTQPAREPELGIREARDLARAIEGKEPGEPVACIPAYRDTNLRVLGNNTLVYRANKNLVWRNTLMGSCNGLSMGDTLVMERTISQYCRGDIARSVNLQIGTMTGTCALGDWVPYRTPGTGK